MKKYFYPYKINQLILIILLSILLFLFVFTSIKKNYESLVNNAYSYLSNKVILEDDEQRIAYDELDSQRTKLEAKIQEYQGILKKKIVNGSLDLSTRIKIVNKPSVLYEERFVISQYIDFDYSIEYGQKFEYTELNSKGVIISRYRYEDGFKDLKEIEAVVNNKRIIIPIKGILETTSKSETIIRNDNLYMTLDDALEYGILVDNKSIYVSYLFEFKDKVEIKDYQLLSRYNANILGRSKLESEYMSSLMPLLTIIKILGSICIVFFVVCLFLLCIERNKHNLITEYISTIYYNSKLKMLRFFMLRSIVYLLLSYVISYTISLFIFLILKSKIGLIYPNPLVFLYVVPLFVILFITDYICYRISIRKYISFKK